MGEGAGEQCQKDLLFVGLEIGAAVHVDDLRLTEFDQVLVTGPGVKAAYVQVGFAQLLTGAAAAAAAATIADGVAVVVVAAGAWWSHLMVAGGRHIRLLWKKENARGSKSGLDGCKSSGLSRQRSRFERRNIMVANIRDDG